MNVIRLMGGLGNQLFQYAFGRGMQENGIKVKYDISNFGKSKHREFMLGNFDLGLEFSHFVGAQTILDNVSVPTFDINYQKMDGKNFFGYWQYLAYFEKILPALRKELCVKKEAYTEEFLKLKDIIRNSKSVSVHVRRDDYLMSSTIPCLPFSYYYEAITRTKGDLFIFSDDIPWCKRSFVEEYFDRNITFVELPYYLDFELMKLCKHNVISNSTFSWWAAILNDNPDKVVVTPDFWITRHDKGQRNNFPKEWIKLNCNV
jgi:hypothetical protein